MTEFMRITQPKKKPEQAKEKPLPEPQGEMPSPGNPRRKPVPGRPKEQREAEPFDFTGQVANAPYEIPKRKPAFPAPTAKGVGPRLRKKKQPTSRLYSKGGPRSGPTGFKKRSITPKRRGGAKSPHSRKVQPNPRGSQSRGGGKAAPGGDFELDAQFQRLEEKFRKFKFQLKKK